MMMGFNRATVIGIRCRYSMAVYNKTTVCKLMLVSGYRQCDFEKQYLQQEKCRNYLKNRVIFRSF